MLTGYRCTDCQKNAMLTCVRLLLNYKCHSYKYTMTLMILYFKQCMYTIKWVKIQIQRIVLQLVAEISTLWKKVII